MIYKLSLDYDGPDGYTLHVRGDDAYAGRIDEDALYEFLDSTEVKNALEHRAEGERERILYLAASPEERAEVIGHSVDADLYCGTCGGAPGFHESKCPVRFEERIA